MSRDVLIRKNDVVTLTVEDLAYGGRGVAKMNGKVVFVDGCFPGDVVRVRITKNKLDFAEAQALEIVQPSPHRVPPRCKHADICGGCRWQNYEYDMQLKYKAEQLRNALVRIAGIDEPTLDPIIGAKKLYNYRNKMEFSFQQDDQLGLVLGLHYAGSFDRVFDVDECHLQSDVANRILRAVRDECKRLGLPAYNIRKHEGVMRFLVIREGKFTGDILVNLITGREYNGYEDRILELGNTIASKFPEIKSLLWTVNSQKANIARWDAYPPMTRDGLLYGRDHIYEKLGRYRFRISADSFFQTNSYQAQVLYDTVMEYADFHSPDKVSDLYCGTGSIAIYISSQVKLIVGVESVVKAIADARINAEENGVHNVTFVVGAVEDVIEQLEHAQKAIIDPPRAGIHPKALKGIAGFRPDTIVYVSCNPATQARDIAGFIREGYKFEKAVAVDMFPHTYHIEAVAKLTLK